jgi:hypothetical protein
MPGDLIAPKNQHQYPTDSTFGFIVRVFEGEKKKIQ